MSRGLAWTVASKWEEREDEERSWSSGTRGVCVCAWRRVRARNDIPEWHGRVVVWGGAGVIWPGEGYWRVHGSEGRLVDMVGNALDRWMYLVHVGVARGDGLTMPQMAGEMEEGQR